MLPTGSSPIRPLPDQHPIPVYLPDPVEGNPLPDALVVHEEKGEPVVPGENQIGKGPVYQALGQPIVIADQKGGIPEVLVPPDPTEHFFYRQHPSPLAWLHNPL